MAGGPPEIDIQRLVDEVRERVRYRQSLTGRLVAAPPPFLPLDGSLVEELKRLTYHWNVYEAPITTGRRLTAPLAMIKRALRRLLAPVLGRQVAFNASTMRIVTELAEQLDMFASRHKDLLEDVMVQHAKTTEALGERVARVERVTRLTHTSQGVPPIPAAPEVDEVPPSTAFDRAAFEERFRDAEDTVQKRQQSYVALFAGRERVVDLGCGRGEFLALLHAAGISAAGVDADLDMVRACRDKGLDTHHDDMFAFLEHQGDGSLGGVFAAQLIEHLPPPRIIALAALVLRKLAPGAAIVLDTPNPGCLTAVAATSYTDCSHVRPIHPDAMRFLLEAAGLEHVEVRFSSPSERDVRFPHLPDAVAGVEFAATFNRAVDHANALLYGCQAYAVIGRRSASQSAAAVA